MVAALPPSVLCSGKAEAKQLAGPDAIDVLGTGSMYPYIKKAPQGADPMKTVVAYVVAGPKKYADIQKGDLVVYYADWAHGCVMHQAAQKDKDGWIMTGLNNAQSESFTRVTPETFKCVISVTYTW